MADASAAAADMASTPQPAKRAAPAVSPKSPPFPPTKIHARYQPDVSKFADEINKKVGEQDHVNALVAFRDFAWEMNRQLQTIRVAFNSHADALEAHHKYIYGAEQAYKTVDGKCNKLIDEVDTLKNLQTIAEGRASAVDEHTRTLERHFNKMTNIESVAENALRELEKTFDFKLETMATDITSKISQMDTVDGKIKEVLQQTLNDTDGGRRIMEMLSGGLSSQGAEALPDN